MLPPGTLPPGTLTSLGSTFTFHDQLVGSGCWGIDALPWGTVTGGGPIGTAGIKTGPDGGVPIGGLPGPDPGYQGIESPGVPGLVGVGPRGMSVGGVPSVGPGKDEIGLPGVTGAVDAEPGAGVLMGGGPGIDPGVVQVPGRGVSGVVPPGTGLEPLSGVVLIAPGG